VRRLTLAALVLAVAGCGGGSGGQTTTPQLELGPPLRLERVLAGLRGPVQVLVAPGEPRRLYVVEQRGVVLLVDRGRRRAFLDLRAKVSQGGERGLLAIAFHPRWPALPRVYASYTDRGGDSRVTEYEVLGDRPRPRRDLVHVRQPYANHNGGQITFGPDSLLYLGLGDGGDAFDREQRSQDPGTFLGKLLRLDVSRPGAEWEVVASGLRNPWRFSFDQPTGDLWIGDVGQDMWEEVDVVRGGVWPTLNFGWDVYEGEERVEDHEPSGGELVWPVAVYGRDVGCSVTGGFVYRGRLEALRGRYVFGDFCSGAVLSLRARDAGGLRRERVRVPALAAFGLDADGELLLVSHAGRVLRLVGPR
jgi:glucose/arabinose dehydrogenase